MPHRDFPLRPLPCTGGVLVPSSSPAGGRALGRGRIGQTPRTSLTRGGNFDRRGVTSLNHPQQSRIMIWEVRERPDFLHPYLESNAWDTPLGRDTVCLSFSDAV